jgi:hypothetical protein
VGGQGPPASGIFACNVEAVEATVQQLGGVLDELENFRSEDDAHAGDLSSNPIRSALDRFYQDSSDQRDKITDSVQALHDMLQALAQGVRDVDQALTASLPDAQAPGPQVPATTAGPR